MRGLTAVAILAAALGAGAFRGSTEMSVEAPASTPSPDLSVAGGGLKELDAMTLSCPRAALNAAARKAAEVPSQGTYQFAYFNILNGSHHARYEVHFESNYEGEPDLKYCVAVTCQEGWDPSQGQLSVTPMSSGPGVAGTTSQPMSCAETDHADGSHANHLVN
jgi:hypothetical protein